MRALAFDPGPERVGYAVLELCGTRAVVVASGLAPATASAVHNIVAAHCGALVAVESVGDYLAARPRARGLFATAHVAGMIRGVSYPAPVVALPAHGTRGRPGWRDLLVGPRANDAMVRAALAGELGSLPRQTSVHERDAMGLAQVVLLLARGGQLAPYTWL